VAGFARGALPELVDHRHARLAAPGDVAGLAVALTEAIELDRDVVRRHAEATCSVTAMLDGYEGLYGGLAAERAA